MLNAEQKNVRRFCFMPLFCTRNNPETNATGLGFTNTLQPVHFMANDTAGILKISVAIPIYNAAKHLEVLFDSLQHQTLKAAEFEIICVNDCSTDNSQQVIEAYQQTMPNIVLLNRTQNSGGPVLPRNDAIAAARGQFIHFVDNDDFLGEEALERLYNAAQANGSDVIYGRYVSVTGRAPSLVMFKKGNLPNANIIEDKLVYSLTPHKMFRTSFLKHHGFLFDEKATAGNDDQLFLAQCLIAAKVVTVLADYPYYYVVARGDNNLSSKFVPAKDWLYVWHRIMHFINAFVPDADYKQRLKIAFFNRLLVRTRFRSFLLTPRTTRAQKIEWLQEAQSFTNQYADADLLQKLEPKQQPFWKAVQENNIDSLLALSVPEPQPKPATTNCVKIKHAGTQSYKRPSTKALKATAFPKKGQTIAVYTSVPGWYEIRHQGANDALFAEFIEKKDTRLTAKYIVAAVRLRVKQYLRRFYKK